MSGQDRPWSPRTLAAQALGHIDAATHGLVPPIHVTTTFLRDPDNQYRTGNVYARPDNATIREAEAIIAALEQALRLAQRWDARVVAATVGPGDADSLLREPRSTVRRRSDQPRFRLAVPGFSRSPRSNSSLRCSTGSTTQC